jgi:ABC-type enterochelin transport system substrate-binding protein
VRISNNCDLDCFCPEGYRGSELIIRFCPLRAQKQYKTYMDLLQDIQFNSSNYMRLPTRIEKKNSSLGKIFDKRVKFEFETKDVESTMNTMVREPYVYHVPVMTG